ncbi:hypothetical protein [Streptomyces sp. NPDC059009]|uniref:hypothetical protein n=1 Tax=Streptomyces sp. NPDC059009 TaxID=3346694 RepID=UPI0036C10940
MNLRKMAGVGIAGAALLGATLTGVAAVPAVAAPAQGDAVQVKHDGCPDSWGWKFTMKETVKIRKHPKRSATALGQAPKGSHPCYVSNQGGGKYKACGKKDDAWAEMRYRGMHGWVMQTCTRGV